MTRRFSRFTAFFLLLPYASANSAPLPKFALAQCFASQTKLTPFLGAVLVSQGSDIFVRTAGTVDGASPVQRNTPFRLASVGKTLTRIAIGQLVARGEIELDAPINRYLPGLSKELGAVTVEQLIQHRGGVTPLLMFTDKTVAVMRGARTAHDLLPLVVGEPLQFKPGEREDYSNGGYFVLGAIIEAVTHQTYDNYMRDALFRRLGMSSTSLTASPGTAVPISSFDPSRPEPLPKPQLVALRSEHGNPAGDAVSTLDDMRKLGEALYGEKLLPSALKLRLFPRHAEVWRIGQAGGAPGTNTYFAAMPELKATVVTLSNYDPPAADLMGSVLANVVAGKDCKPLSEADRPSLLKAGTPPPMQRPAEPPKR